MRFYIAYKFMRNKNKDELKVRLEEVSDLLVGQGHDTFILGRDVKKWKHIHLGSFKLIPTIYKNMKQCDVVAAYVDSQAFSKGLFFEVLISKLLGKKSYLFLVNGINSTFLKYLFNGVYSIDSIADIGNVNFE